MSGKVATFPRVQSMPSSLSNLLDQARGAFESEPFPTIKTRRQWLETLRLLLVENQQQLREAIDSDFGGRSPMETSLGELLPAIEGIDHHLKYLRFWLQRDNRSPGFSLWPSKAWVEYHPLGVVGVMVPWNYPLYLAIGPLTAALAAGNRVLVKMSEHTPVTAALFARLIGQYFSPAVVQVVQGDAKVAAAFSRLPFDHLVFTGSTAVGRMVMHAASENLTPVTLELGGKSPALINDDVPLALAAERLLFGKCFNAGQTCVAPDYVLVPKGKGQALAEAMLAGFNRRYPDWQDNGDYASIINGAQYQRLCGYLDEARNAGCQMLHSGPDRIDSRRRLGLHLIINPPLGLAVMQEEIFGPILPIIEYDNLAQAVGFIRARPKPLAFYPFSFKKKVQRRLLDEIHAGGVCINDTLLQVAAADLPFGGIGPAGMGHYHGKEGVLSLSKAKPVLKRGRWTLNAMIYPPYTKGALKAFLTWMLR
ncbi:coniferyl aldehyde dehydrogenase [Gallaecimonas pentaromativorans]|uniref:coniferyl aldehyde dehydrogenase n=1 Tax=Gallaecimonas pentaromativorans TaxID=584787 RepID=UPI003A922994